MMIEDIVSLSYPEWKLYIDRASRSQGSKAGVILIGPSKIQIKCAIKLKYNAINNATEYKVLLTGFKLAIEVMTEHLKVYSDS